MNIVKSNYKRMFVYKKGVKMEINSVYNLVCKKMYG